MRVLSLFDGISGCQQALERLGVEVSDYYASEVDKHAIKVTMYNYPRTVQLGDVRGVRGVDLGKIDLLAGGSPCQSFSFAGKRKGMSTKDSVEIYTLDHYLELKEQNFEFEGQSYLFWEYMRLLGELREVNPGIKFLLENVMMGEKWQRVLSRAIGINPIEINSSLVSAQNRRRLYWTNIGAESDGLFGDLVCKIVQPKDRGILLRDVLEEGVDEKYYLSEKMLSYLNKNTKLQKQNGNGFRYKPKEDFNIKSNSITTKEGTRMDDNFLIVHNMQPSSGDPSKGGTGHLTRTDGKTYCLDTGNTNAVEIVAMRGRDKDGKIEQQIEANGTGKSNSLTTVQKDNLVLGGDFRHDEGFRWRQNGKSGVLNARGRSDGNDFSGQPLTKINSRIRRLTPVECCRLQTVRDDYFKDKDGNNIISESQQYKGLGNGWTIEVIAHIFSYL
jgi:site-specific DNA-cytosine methylase